MYDLEKSVEALEYIFLRLLTQSCKHPKSQLTHPLMPHQASRNTIFTKLTKKKEKENFFSLFLYFTKSFHLVLVLFELNKKFLV